MGLEKNTAGKWVVFAYGAPDHASAGLAITGDAANITANVRIDGGAVNAVDDTNPTELEDGFYVFDITAAEANGDVILICPVSSTSDVIVIGAPAVAHTVPANFNALGIESDGNLTKVNTLHGHTAQTGDTYALANGSAGFVAIDTVVDAILADTGTTLPATLAGLNDFDPASDTVANVTLVATTTTNTDMRGTDSANTTVPDAAGTAAALHTTTDAAIAVVDGVADAILVDTGTTLPATLTTIDTVVDAILIDTGTTLPAAIPSVSDIWTTALTEAYRSTGATGTAAQLMYELIAHLGEHANSGTTRTLKKLDGSTTAKTYTYDDATSPTSITEAT